ncbi:hypothetical protein [Clostridium botulinum]|nr:hypothetical protein [Clostridium botulinum]
MLMFNEDRWRGSYENLAFKYISCYCSTETLVDVVLMFFNLNTSHLIVQP